MKPTPHHALIGLAAVLLLAAATLAGLRQAVTFKLEGQLDDPTFPINDRFATQPAGGKVEGMGDLLKGLLGR